MTFPPVALLHSTAHGEPDSGPSPNIAIVSVPVFESVSAVPGASYCRTGSRNADLLGIALARLRNKISVNHALPPRIQPPGCRHRLWRRSAVHD